MLSRRSLFRSLAAVPAGAIAAPALLSALKLERKPPGRALSLVDSPPWGLPFTPVRLVDRKIALHWIRGKFVFSCPYDDWQWNRARIGDTLQVRTPARFVVREGRGVCEGYERLMIVKHGPNHIGTSRENLDKLLGLA